MLNNNSGTLFFKETTKIDMYNYTLYMYNFTIKTELILKYLAVVCIYFLK